MWQWGRYLDFCIYLFFFWLLWVWLAFKSLLRIHVYSWDLVCISVIGDVGNRGLQYLSRRKNNIYGNFAILFTTCLREPIATSQ